MKRTHILKCSEVADHICDNLDNELQSARCREIRQHIRDCPNCYAYLDSMKKTVRLYKIERSPPLSDRTRRKLFAVLKLHSLPPAVRRSRS